MPLNVSLPTGFISVSHYWDAVTVGLNESQRIAPLSGTPARQYGHPHFFNRGLALRPKNPIVALRTPWRLAARRMACDLEGVVSKDAQPFLLLAAIWTQS